MMRSLAAALTLAAGWSLTDLNLDRLRWNARERTAAGIESLDAGSQGTAIEAFETAARLDPLDPVLRFNAGSAHLIAGGEGAIHHLELAAETAPEELGAQVNYNLGNARLLAGDPAGAIEAYEQSLRLDADHLDAKFNLELALQQQQQQKDQQQQDDQSEPSDQGQEDRQPSPAPPEDAPEQDQEQEQDQRQQPGEGEQQERPLPQFEEQPEMTAEQAAAILEAVENLEREQRRKQAEQEMKKRPRKGKDW